MPLRSLSLRRRQDQSGVRVNGTLQRAAPPPDLITGWRGVSFHVHSAFLASLTPGSSEVNSIPPALRARKRASI